MKRLILVKELQSVDVGHLYEHMFAISISSFFMTENIFQYVDYSLVAKTHAQGLVVIDLELYSDKAIKLSSSISKLKVEFTEKFISNTATQLLAEEEKPLAIPDLKQLFIELNEIQARPWQNLTELTYIDTASSKLTDGAFFVAEGEPRLARKLDVALSINRKDVIKKDHPLFHEIAQLIIENFQIPLAEQFNYYSYSDRYEETANELSWVNTFKVADADGVNPNLEEVITYGKSIFTNMLQSGAIERYTQTLSETSIADSPNTMPDFERNLADTGVLTGQKGWHHNATADTLHSILSSAKISVHFETKTITQNLLP